VKVAFLHAKQDPKYAVAMVASVKRHMPGVEVLQLTDDTTTAIEGCTAVRLPWNGEEPMILKMTHLSKLTGDILALDTDVIVQADVSGVFSLPFDVALTWRDGPIRGPKGEDITKLMPINCGVMFCRNPEFWHACIQLCMVHEIEHWCADQLTVPHVARQFNTLRLHCDNFNYTPNSKNEDVNGRLIVHYKGNRKEWMLPL